MVGFSYERYGVNYFTPSQELAFLRATHKVEKVYENGFKKIVWEWEERSNEIEIIKL